MVIPRGKADLIFYMCFGSFGLLPDGLPIFKVDNIKSISEQYYLYGLMLLRCFERNNKKFRYYKAIVLIKLKQKWF